MEFKPNLYNLDQAENFLKYLNSKHANIKFTKEVEAGGSLPFLDISVTRNNNKFETSVYRKGMFSESLNWE